MKAKTERGEGNQERTRRAGGCLEDKTKISGIIAEISMLILTITKYGFKFDWFYFK